MAVAATTTISPTGLAQVQGDAALTFIRTQLTAAGFRLVRAYPWTTVGYAYLYRYPSIDDFDTRPDMIVLWSYLGTIRIEDLFDVNVNDVPLDPPTSSPIWSSGAFTGGTWPSTGAPALGDIYSDGTSAAITFDGLSTYTLRVIASEYGLTAATSSGATTRLMMHDRFLEDTRLGREMEVRGCLSTGTYPVTFAAPTGAPAVHLRFLVESITVNVTFPASPLTAFRVAQEITRQGSGLLEAYVRPRVGETDEIVVRIPQGRGPAGNYSGRPDLALVYQDPTITAGNLRFHIGTSAGWTVVAGAPGSLRKSGFNFPLSAIREGATVYNHTANASTTVTVGLPFSTTSTQDDTAELANTVGWTSSDTIEVYPGPETTTHARLHYGGCYQAVLSGAECSDIEDGADRILVLSDIYGEAQDQFEVGQAVILTNNGFAVTLTLSSVVGTFLHGEEVISNVGTRGFIRGMAVTNITVDVTETAAGGVPFTATETLTGQVSGATATLTPEAVTTARTGWSGRFTVLAKGQVDAANGDYRTTLTLDMDAAGVNTSFVVGPGAVVGSHAKFAVGWETAAGFATFSLPLIATYSFASDVNQNESLLVTEPAHEPDWETHALQLAEYVIRINPGTAMGTDVLGVLTHVRGVNARNSTAVLGDRIAEDGDANRYWIPSVQLTGSALGAGSNPNFTQWVCLGPGGVA